MDIRSAVSRPGSDAARSYRSGLEHDVPSSVVVRPLHFRIRIRAVQRRQRCLVHDDGLDHWIAFPGNHTVRPGGPMMPLPSCLLSVNNYFYPRGGAEGLFLEQNRMFESIGWQVVPFAMRHADNLPTPWAAYVPDEIEFGRSYGLGDKFLRAQRVVFSHQAQRRMRALLDHVQPHIAHVHNIYHHLSPSILPL